MRFTNRVLSLHPAIVTILFVALFAIAGIAINIYPLGSAESSLIFSVSMLLMIGPLLLWHYSLYRAASDRGAPFVGHNGRRAIFFLLAALGIGALLILYPLLKFSAFNVILIAAPVSMVVGNLSYFASVWAAANALTRFDDRTKSSEFSKTLGTFFLAVYLPIGIWVIYPRIKRMLAEPISNV